MTRVLIEGGNLDTDAHTRTPWKTGGKPSRAKRPPETKKETWNTPFSRPYSPQSEHGPTDTSVQASSLQIHDRTNVLLSKPLDLLYFVVE